MDNLLAQVSSYYTEKIERFGAQPLGVDWNGFDGQVLRFAQLCKLLLPGSHFSVTDVGCGYGALLDFLLDNFDAFDYVGIDISEAMVDTATKMREQHSRSKFIVGAEPPHPTDYVVASGIFNVKLGADTDMWRAYIESTLEVMNRFSTRGFAFNCLTGYSDAHKMRADLHYADPCELFDMCKRRYSRNVALLHDYDLYEFTILVRK
ncbi:class I SAM-dependent methyltransferase [Paraburkholderia sp. BCC1884]|uniref:class I SAM-dependent methyltransferase n=1 Tax=Paraburkholderia sp. BCC1884 TaxID=2562668 RepID=UPI0011842EA6|nr:class I SAM-dependent methyltransferase [Paraburkholderia sp. BCC1884]